MSRETDNYLAHFGVVGMKWGKRSGGSSSGSSKTKSNTELHPKYEKSKLAYDKQTHGEKYTKRVNKELHAGKDLKEARTAVTKRARKNANIQAALGLSLWVAGSFGGHILYAGQGVKMKVDDAVRTKQAANGKKYTDGLFADSRGVGSKPMVNLGYNKDTDTWE